MHPKSVVGLATWRGRKIKMCSRVYAISSVNLSPPHRNKCTPGRIKRALTSPRSRGKEKDQRSLHHRFLFFNQQEDDGRPRAAPSASAVCFVTVVGFPGFFVRMHACFGGEDGKRRGGGGERENHAGTQLVHTCIDLMKGTKALN